MTGPPPGAGVAAEGFLRGRWVEEVEEDIVLIGVWRKRIDRGDCATLLIFPPSFRSLDFRLIIRLRRPARLGCGSGALSSELSIANFFFTLSRGGGKDQVEKIRKD